MSLLAMPNVPYFFGLFKRTGSSLKGFAFTPNFWFDAIENIVKQNIKNFSHKYGAILSWQSLPSAKFRLKLLIQADSTAFTVQTFVRALTEICCKWRP